MEPLLLGAVIVAAGGFAFLNGFHVVSNSVATAVRTRALTPTVAVLLAALFNLIGARLSTSLALFFTDAALGLPEGATGL
ncbi:MAG: phosphate transporter, partial [Micrococcaceae bacterium]|nr:phosphate transporter [Micrococcaceae bacterium]